MRAQCPWSKPFIDPLSVSFHVLQSIYLFVCRVRVPGEKWRHQLKFHWRVHPYISMRERDFRASTERMVSPLQAKRCVRPGMGQEGPISSRKKDDGDCGAADSLRQGWRMAPGSTELFSLLRCFRNRGIKSFYRSKWTLSASPSGLTFAAEFLARSVVFDGDPFSRWIFRGWKLGMSLGLQCLEEFRLGESRV